MCECQKRFKSLLEDHRRCRSIIRPPMSRYNTPEPEIEPEIESVEPVEPVEPEIEPVEPIKVYQQDPKPEFKDPEIVRPKSPIIILENIKDDEDDVELTDISPQELEEQEKEAERIRQELAILELTRLTRKKVRKTK